MVSLHYALRVALVGLFLFSVPIGYIILSYARYDELWKKTRRAQIVDKIFDSQEGRLKYYFILRVEDRRRNFSDQNECVINKEQYDQAIIGEYIDNPFYEDIE